ncbi:MAG TPA: DUF4242 domain-containing protein [Bacteroidota bacterium]|nr:DUF4242 domain-containing protein [Bacteroidota bacterium]
MKQFHDNDEKNALFLSMSRPYITGVIIHDPINNEGKEIQMPLFMDIHTHVPGLTDDAAEGAHAKDLETQDQHGAQYLKYWYDKESGKVFCLINAPTKEAAAAVHRDGHGLVADEIVEVKEGL